MTWFDAAAFDPSGVASQFPVGRHPVIIKSSSQQAVKDKPTEGMLILQLEVFDGPAKGAVGPYRLNIWNASEQTREIASKQLSAICHVVGTHQLVDKVNMCSELFGKPFVIVVSQQTDARYTQIDGVLDMAGNQAKRGQVPTQPPQGQPMQQAPMQQAPAAPSWQQPPNAAPAQAPAAAPSWQASGQAPAQAAPPQQAAPSWQAPGQVTVLVPSAAAAQPSWASPPVGGAPSWGR